MPKCRACEYSPCACGRNDYARDFSGHIVDDEDAPSSNCRECDYNPCMCGKKNYVSERQHRERVEKEIQERLNDPMNPFTLDMDNY